MEKIAKLETNQGKPDKKGKGKAKADPKSANFIARIDDILIIDRMEEIDSYNERVFITPESDKANKVVQMDVDDEVEEMTMFMKMLGNFMLIMTS